MDKAYVVQHVGDLNTPQSLNTLSDFEAALELLYPFKHHHHTTKDLKELLNLPIIPDPCNARYSPMQRTKKVLILESESEVDDEE
ncbi:hypothetical protein O0I10_012482 [Lichtheimia ornata]|uniref:Uncharacterized protein n=1 Tax=Lichtheimia ornata TaxID=688661 RepID=A0AAD7XRP1_9FUNG|nr:uncharacterized protein O0I10_012482 [Lichtheimia ornata]KAJ8651935.1 hypothetical protein O0I10_012482 [Lichtheimia ornata]